MEEKSPPPPTVIVPSAPSTTSTDLPEKNESLRLSTTSSVTDQTDSTSRHSDDHFDMLRGSKPSRANGMLDSLTVNKLRLSELGLVGRESELEQLQHCLDRCCCHVTTSNETSTSADGEQGPSSSESKTATRELVFLEGESGTGKSELVKTFVEGHNKKNNSTTTKNTFLKKLVLQGKFDQFSAGRPISAFLNAFSQLGSELGEENLHQKAFVDFQASLKQAFNDDRELLELLLELVPSLRPIVNERNPEAHGNGSDKVGKEGDGDNNNKDSDSSQNEETQELSSKVTTTPVTTTISTLEGNRHCVQQVFCKLCRVLTEHFAPVVLLIDDCQWADAASLELLEALYSDNDNSKILFVVCMRPLKDNNHPLTQLRTRLITSTKSNQSSSSPSNITNLTIGNLTLEHSHTVITTLLDSVDKADDSEKTLDLSKICYQRTHGNALFLLQFLIMLQEDGLIEFNLGLYCWKWDLARIEAKTAATENVVNMVMHRLLSKLPEDLPLSFLQLASCLGSMFNDRVLALAWKHVAVMGGENVSNRQAFQETLDAAVRGNFLEACSGGIRRRSSEGDSHQQQYHQWLHDKIQEAALSSITTSSSTSGLGVTNEHRSGGDQNDVSSGYSNKVVDNVKYHIGMSLLQHLNEEELDQEVFVVANLITGTFQPPNGFFLATTVDLFLRAAEKARSLGSFQTAYRYASSGISLLLPLKEKAWEDDKHFDRSLRLHSIAVEAAGFLGYVDDMLRYTEVVLNQARCSIFDKLRVYLVKLEYLQNNGEAFAAVDLGLQILCQLGCKFSKNKAIQAVQTVKAVNKLKRKAPTEAQLRKLSPMTNRNTIEIVKVIFRLEASFYYTRQVFLYALVSIKSVELVLENGLCDYSGGAFFAIGNILAALSNDLKYLRTWCALSDLIVTELVPNGYHESRAAFANCCGFLWSQPALNQRKRFLHGYKVGMKVGDTESAMWNCCHFLYYEFLGGCSLDILQERCQYYLSYMKELKRNEAVLVGIPVWRLVLDLTQPITEPYTSVETGTELGSQSKSVVDQFMGSIDQVSPVAPYFARMTENLLHAYRRDYVAGAELSIQRGNEFLGNFPHQPTGIWDMCLRGVCLYAAAMNTTKGRYYRHARKTRKTIDKWLSQGNVNVRHYAALLAAEDLTINGKLNEARVSYESAIVAASRGGFIHDSAIANERYALFLLEKMSDKENAMFHFGEAERLYREWGAAVVLEGLHQIMAKRGLLLEPNEGPPRRPSEKLSLQPDKKSSISSSLNESESPLRRLRRFGRSISSSISSLGNN